MSLGLCLNSVRTKMWTVSNVDHGHGPGLLVKCVWGICSSDLVPQNNYYTMKLLITIYIYVCVCVYIIYYKVIFPSIFSCRIMLLKFPSIKANFIYIYINIYIYLYLKWCLRNSNVWTGYFSPYTLILNLNFYFGPRCKRNNTPSMFYLIILISGIETWLLSHL